MTTKITLAEIVETAGDIPQEGMLNLLGRVANKARRGEIELEAAGDLVSKMHIYFTSKDDLRGEEIERTFSYLFATAGRSEEAKGSYQKHIQLLEKRAAYGMAGDVAVEAARTTRDIAFTSTANRLFNFQIQEMDKERRSDPSETNEGYYDEMLFKAGRLDEFRGRKEKDLKYWLGRGEFKHAAKICGDLGRPAEAERYQKLADILA